MARRDVEPRAVLLHVIEVDDPNPYADPVLVMTPVGLKVLRPKVMAKVNLAKDVLRRELLQGNISQGAYDRGRKLEKLFEFSSPGGGGQWRQGDRVDAASAHEQQIAAGVLDYGTAAAEAKQEIARECGKIMGQTLIWVLQDRYSFAEVAQLASGHASARRISYYAQQFREALEAYHRLKDTATGARGRR